MLVLWGKGAMRSVRLMRACALAVALLACVLCAAAASAAPQSGVYGSTWQDNDRNHRRSPNQIVTQLRTSPKDQAGSMPLADASQNQRAAKTTSRIVSGEASLPQNGQMDLLGPGDWRIKILAAAVTNTDMVLLGDIAQPLGQMDQNIWNRLREQKLWPAPPTEGKPLQINRTRLAQALRQALGKEVAGRCILPSSLVIQRGGLVFREDDLRSYVVKSLTPQLSAMPGEVELSDFRLPDYIFLAHAQQRVQLEPGKLTPGRVPLRFAVQEADGTVLRRISGTVNLTLWITAPAASHPLNKGEALTAQSVTFMKVNASQLRELPWDGRGGPWQLNRALNTGEPILQSDLVSQLMVKRGDVVNLVYIKGNLRITTQAQALGDGEPGATIAVRNLQTKKQVYGTVKDGSTVEIH